jgi:hypothetical protein
MCILDERRANQNLTSQLPTVHELGLIPDHKSGENIKIREDAISRAFVGRS